MSLSTVLQSTVLSAKFLILYSTNESYILIPQIFYKSCFIPTLVGAPRLLQAIAQDEVISFLSVFKVVTKRGEPLRAQLLTYAISQSAVLIASIDAITPLITM